MKRYFFTFTIFNTESGKEGSHYYGSEVILLLPNETIVSKFEEMKEKAVLSFYGKNKQAFEETAKEFNKSTQELIEVGKQFVKIDFIMKEEF